MAETPDPNGPTQFGTEENPFQVAIPGWDDFVHTRPPPKLTTEQWRDYFRFQEDREELRLRLGERNLQWMDDQQRLIEAIKASPAPDPAQFARKVLIALDEAQDYLFTAQAGAAGLSLAAPGAGLPLLGILALLDGAVDLASSLFRLPIGTSKKRGMIDEHGKRRRGNKSLRERGLRALRGMTPARVALGSAQAAYTMTGVGTTLGSAFIFAEDVVWGTIQAARGEQVEIQHDPNAGSFRRALETGLNTTWSWLAGQFLSVDQHLTLAVAQRLSMQQAMGYTENTALRDRAELAADWPLPHKRMWAEGSRELMRQNGMDPDGPQVWPFTDFPQQLTLREALDRGAEDHPKWREEMDQRLEKTPAAHFLAELADDAARQPFAVLAGTEDPYADEWTEDEGFLLNFLENAPVSDRLHPAAAKAGLDSALNWWQQNRGTYINRPGAPPKPERWREVALQAYRHGFLPEVRRAGGAPRLWLDAGHQGAVVSASGPLDAWRKTTTDHGPNTLRIQERQTGQPNRDIDPLDEWPLDQIAPAQILQDMRDGILADRIRAIELQGATTIKPGHGAYPTFKPATLLPDIQIDQPTRDYDPEQAELRTLWHFGPENFGVYGGTHPNDWTDGGVENNPFLNVPWGDRWTSYRNDRAFIEKREAERLEVSRAELATVFNCQTPYPDARAWINGSGRCLDCPHCYVALEAHDTWAPRTHLVDGWIVESAGWGGADFPPRAWTNLEWNADYTSQPVVLWSRWDPLTEERVNVRTGIQFKGDLRLTLRDWALDQLAAREGRDDTDLLRNQEDLFAAVEDRVDRYLAHWQTMIFLFGGPHVRLTLQGA